MARPRRPFPTWPIWLLLCGLSLIGLRLLRGRSSSELRLPPSDTPVQVLRAIDGDTLLLADGSRVRLIGVDTPETKHPDRPPELWGPQAAAYTHSRVDGRVVTLQYDRERLDPYRRVLAFVWIEGELLNESLIREGYSRAVTSFPYRSDLQRRFQQAEKAARTQQLRIWAGSAATE
ncbi:MAG: thermonuclease family protein [Planctomycetaceae bacterium]